MKYNATAETLEEGLSLSPERAAELNQIMNDAFGVLLQAAKPFNTNDVAVMVAACVATPAEGFYVGWATRGVLAQYANVRTS